MNDVALWSNEMKINRTIEALKKNNINGYYAKNRDEFIKLIEDIVAEGSKVAVGGSETLSELGVLEYLRSGRYDFLDRYKAGLTPEEVTNIFKQSFLADAYLSGCNAITENGELYNVDGNGNRVAAMLYGPDKVIVICGK